VAVLQKYPSALALTALIAACAGDRPQAHLSRSLAIAAAPAPVSTVSPSPRTVRICGFWVLGAFVPPGATGVCDNERLPVLSVTWSLDQTYRYYVSLARAQQFGVITEYAYKPVNHSVPISYYHYTFDILANSHDYQFELYPRGSGTRITVRTSTHYASFANRPIPAPTSLPPPPYYRGIQIPIGAPFSRFVTPQSALTSAQRAIASIAPKGYAADPYWVALKRIRETYLWEVRTAGGPLYSRASLVYFASVDALSGRVLSVRAERNILGLPIPPNPTQSRALNPPTPCPQGMRNLGPARTPPPNAIPGQNYNCPRSIAKITLPGNATAPISAFSQAFASALALPANYGYKRRVCC
jgi:hypothetical protein